MKFMPTNGYMEVSLQEGLNAIQLENFQKLFSDGLGTSEYIYFDHSKGFCNKDGSIIGGTFDQALDTLHSLKWCFRHKFYVEKESKEISKEVFSNDYKRDD